VLTKEPNAAHVAIAECEARLEKEGICLRLLLLV